MRYLRKFKNATEYAAYLNGDSIALPRVSLIINAGEEHTVDDRYNDNGPSWVDFSIIGTNFVEIYNDDTMAFTNQVYDNIAYSASIQGDQIVLSSYNIDTKQPTSDVSLVVNPLSEDGLEQILAINDRLMADRWYRKPPFV